MKTKLHAHHSKGSKYIVGEGVSRRSSALGAVSVAGTKPGLHWVTAPAQLLRAHSHPFLQPPATSHSCPEKQFFLLFSVSTCLKANSPLCCHSLLIHNCGLVPSATNRREGVSAAASREGEGGWLRRKWLKLFFPTAWPTPSFLFSFQWPYPSFLLFFPFSLTTFSLPPTHNCNA